LKYYGVDVTMEQIVEGLKKGPLPYQENGITYGANPEKEFVGSPEDPSSYGVFNEPIREVAEKYKSGARTKTNADFDDIEGLISNGNPVIAWYTTNLDNGIAYRREWLDYETGEAVRWPSFEHAVVIYGFDDHNIFYNDPNTGSGVSMSKKHFKQAFDELGGRIVYYDN
ncbi:MAG: C39 family peptidase, partial [Clostridia bacterium]|nr:C39 family peptidase [Clostridia bacterium]